MTEKRAKVERRSAGASKPVIDASALPEGKRMVLQALPVRTAHPDLKWYRGKDGQVVVKIRKNFSRFERGLHKLVGGPEWLRIPLDKPGSAIWELCDGDHNILEICSIVGKRFKEDVEPVVPRVVKFIELLLKRNLIILKRADEMVKKKGSG